MGFPPKSLLARTSLVIVFALLISQGVSVFLFRYYSRDPRAQTQNAQTNAIGFVSHLRTLRAALEVLPENKQNDFLQHLREEKGIRVYRNREEVLEPAPDSPPLRTARERLREEFGQETDIYVRPNAQPTAQPVLVVRFVVGGNTFYAVFPRGRVVAEPDFSWAWIDWAIAGAVMALAGAFFLMWRVTQPLKALADAARQLGQGKKPAPVKAMGPSEVQDVAVAFNQMRDDLDRLDRERATFLAGVSHDLRTPLARLRLGIEMASADASARGDLERDITDINSIIDQFMDFARGEASEVQQPLNLNQLAAGAAERAARSGIHVTLQSAELPPLMLRPMAMQRAVDNLIQNAAKHGGGEITMETRQDGAAQVLAVMDRGTGIPVGDVERLKQPFTRMDPSRSGESGAGLGLAIVDRIARMHVARFDLLPRLGGGTEARLTFATAA